MKNILAVVAILAGIGLSFFNMASARAQATATAPVTKKTITLNDLLGVPPQNTVAIINTTTNTVKK